MTDRPTQGRGGQSEFRAPIVAVKRYARQIIDGHRVARELLQSLQELRDLNRARCRRQLRYTALTPGALKGEHDHRRGLGLGRRQQDNIAMFGRPISVTDPIAGYPPATSRSGEIQVKGSLESAIGKNGYASFQDAAADFGLQEQRCRR